VEYSFIRTNIVNTYIVTVWYVSCQHRLKKLVHKNDKMANKNKQVIII
jgi:hypothetical protein